jgi:hypothetical protein
VSIKEDDAVRNPADTQASQAGVEEDEGVFDLEDTLGAQDDLEDDDELYGSSLPTKCQYWLCAHDEHCKRKFESLVLYVEHLTQHGLITYRHQKAIRHNDNRRLPERDVKAPKEVDLEVLRLMETSTG